MYIILYSHDGYCLSREEGRKPQQSYRKGIYYLLCLHLPRITIELAEHHPSPVTLTIFQPAEQRQAIRPTFCCRSLFLVSIDFKRAAPLFTAALSGANLT
jgi:hypothetical protein